jgi:hypothetical protein
MQMPLSMRVPFLDLRAHHAPLQEVFQAALAEVKTQLSVGNDQHGCVA